MHSMMLTVKQIHAMDKRTACYRGRTSGWICPRCRVQFSTERHATHHISKTCWKTCDECCASDTRDCNAHGVEGPCTSCAEAGKTCSKHTKAVAECPPLHEVAPSVNPTQDSLALVGNISTQRPRKKRKAIASPENSPESEPKPKRVRPCQSTVAPMKDDTPGKLRLYPESCSRYVANMLKTYLVTWIF
ncbi:hypothetical protein DE146DRAFT_388552 [Phaeosphaeria sp. MPI-PUGE-AT-0046c]|nr:hypothetical protein DE146DRAFT_388552 [Phaeosphaeria sp. MPI-PUGE-AT-0046c]